MKRKTLFAVLLALSLSALPAECAGRLIVRVANGLPGLQALCGTLGCTVGPELDGSLGKVFLVLTPDGLTPVIENLLTVAQGILDVEPDLLAHTADAAYAIPSALYDVQPVTYFGQTVPDGYVHQPATAILRILQTEAAYQVKGKGIVAVVDTGVDANHPALRDFLVPGYDFTRNRSEADETQDVDFSQTPQTDGASPAWVNPGGAALVDQSTASVVDGNPQYSDFGHGTMVAGIIHLTAPGALLMPLKAFSSDGTGYTSDILRATYWAVDHGANVINMSFNLPGYSREMKFAVDYAVMNRVVCVAAAGNSGKEMLVYPAAFPDVMGVASTTNDNQRSSFSNYGQQLVWVAAPGEGVITTYPFGTYAAGWGTSFSAPFVSGVVAMMLDLDDDTYQGTVQRSVGQATPLGPELGRGLLDTFQAVQAWQASYGYR